MRGKTPDLTGRRFARLVVIRRDGKDSCGASMWLCRCKCGSEKRVRAKGLLNGTQVSCGCYRDEKKASCGGMYGTPEYVSWAGMIDRCRRSKSQSFHNYGGRGIGVCKRWQGRTGFLNFLADMGNKPTAKHTIERKDNDKGYSPENCRWATKAEQAVNTRHARKITYDGRTMCVMEWSRETGIHWQTIIRRLNSGKTPGEALSVPPRPQRGPITFNGQTMTMTDWAKTLDLTLSALCGRFRKGWPLDQALSSGDKRKKEKDHLMPLDPENQYTRMQRRVYAEEAAKWSPTNRDPVVGAWDQHEAWADYDLLFAGFDTSQMIALDFGCGPGRMMQRYYPRFWRIDGADIDKSNCFHAARWVENPHGESIRSPVLYHVNGVQLDGVPSGVYDLVYSAICLQHIPVHAIRLNLFREFFRVLKPGGWFTAQMGYGDAGDPRGVGYYEDKWDAPGTNGGCDCLVTDPFQIDQDLFRAGFDTDTFSNVIRPAGPNDWHRNWVFFRAQKPEEK